MVKRNPSSVDIVAPFAVVDGVTHFLVTIAAPNSNPVAQAAIARPPQNPDGSFTVALASVFATMSPAYYGIEYAVSVAGVNAIGNGLPTQAADTVVYQPIPAAPQSVAVN
jgi:hypothetical protein